MKLKSLVVGMLGAQRWTLHGLGYDVAKSTFSVPRHVMTKTNSHGKTKSAVGSKVVLFMRECSK